MNSGGGNLGRVVERRANIGESGQVTTSRYQLQRVSMSYNESARPGQSPSGDYGIELEGTEVTQHNNHLFLTIC